MDYQIEVLDITAANAVVLLYLIDKKKADGYRSGLYEVPSYNDDIGAVSDYGNYSPAPILHTTKIPTGIRKALNWVKDNYNNPSIMITENGYGTLGERDDVDRIDYYKQYIDNVLDAIELDGCNVVRIHIILIAAYIVSIPTARPVHCSAKAEMRKLPEGLKLGVATAAFQIEGGWDAADKSPSIWDTFTHIPGTIKDGTYGNDTCKSYEYFQRDIEMLKFLGVDFYRFSISWPRVLPTGFANKISEEGIGYYSRLVDELLANGIEPVATIYHWDLPQSLQDLGGWANPLIADWFEDYARVLYDTLGDRVTTWITLNEPKQFIIFGYGTKRFAPDIVSPGIGEYIAVKNALMAHARAWHLYDEEYRATQKGCCGITIATDFREGASDSSADIEAGKLAMDFEIGFYSHPIFSSKGGFPERMIKRIAKKSAEQGYPRSRLPELSKEEIEFIKGTSDFFGFNHYSTKFFSADKYKSGMFHVPSHDDDIGAVGDYGNYKEAPVIHTTKIPTGIRKALNWVKDKYNNPPVMINENGYGTLGEMDDVDRIDYYKQYIENILDAIEVDGCNVVTYTAWSLMDNFEWSAGHSAKFGLFEVDFKDDKKTRKARSSALWYRNLIANRALDHNDNPKPQDISF